MGVGRVVRIAAAVAILIGGVIHLDLYFDGYRAIPDIGRSFMLNVIASGVVAAAVAARRDWFVRVAGIGLAVGTIVAFVLSRTGDGLFDFREEGLSPSPQSALALIVEIAAIVLLAATFVPAIAERDTSLPTPLLGAAAAVAAIVLVGYGLIASGDSDPPAEAGAGDGSSIQIADFAFVAPDATVAKGTTVTWTNDDGAEHSVNSIDGLFNSDPLGRGGTFEFTFDTDGSFSYICGIHPRMTGTVTVTG